MKKNSENYSKIIGIILVTVFAVNTVGCDAVMKKFTRKKKAKQVRPMFYKEAEGEPERPPVELYSMHYVYWKTWMDDLIANAGKNTKRDKRAAAEAIGNLMDMKKYSPEFFFQYIVMLLFHENQMMCKCIIIMLKKINI